MRRSENHCANCGGKFGLVSYRHWSLRFCRKACKDDFLAKTAKDHARMRKWFGRAASSMNATATTAHAVPSISSAGDTPSTIGLTRSATRSEETNNRRILP